MRRREFITLVGGLYYHLARTKRLSATVKNLNRLVETLSTANSVSAHCGTLVSPEARPQ
jgi:hypothetical protein